MATRERVHDLGVSETAGMTQTDPGTEKILVFGV
jgi:hypothetical protein